MQDFRRLNVWVKAHKLALCVYEATRGYPADERFALLSQTRRAAASIPTNIAEGCGRGSDADFRRFLLIASGSACELDYLLILGKDLGYLASSTYPDLHLAVTEVKRMLGGLIGSLTFAKLNTES